MVLVLASDVNKITALISYFLSVLAMTLPVISISNLASLLSTSSYSHGCANAVAGSLPACATFEAAKRACKKREDAKPPKLTWRETLYQHYGKKLLDWLQSGACEKKGSELWP